MSFRDELEAKVNEIRRLALEKLYKEWLFGIPSRPAPGQRQSEDAQPPWGQVADSFAFHLLNPQLARFWQFGEGDPVILQRMLDALGPAGQPIDPEESLEALGEMTGFLTVMENVRSVEKEFGPIGTMVSGWHGAVANFLAALQHRAGEEDEEGVIDRQLAYAAALGAVVSAGKETLERARQDVLDLADATIQGLESYLDGRDSVSRDLVFLVVGSVASVMRASPWIGVALAFADYFIGLQDAAPEEADEQAATIEGDSVAAIISSMGQEITKLESGIADQDAALADGVVSALNAIEGSALDDFKLVLDEMSGDPAAHSVPDGSDLALVYEDAYKAGAVYFSAAAYYYDRAVYRLDLLTMGTENGFGPWFPRLAGHVPYRASWGELVGTLQAALRDSRDYLHQSGQTLCQVVIELAALDGINAESLREAARELESDPDITTVEELEARREAEQRPARPGVPN